MRSLGDITKDLLVCAATERPLAEAKQNLMCLYENGLITGEDLTALIKRYGLREA